VNYQVNCDKFISAQQHFCIGFFLLTGGNVNHLQWWAKIAVANLNENKVQNYEFVLKTAVSETN